VNRFSVGPFTVDVATKTVTMAPGVYTLHKPFILSLHESAVFESICYQALVDVNAAPQLPESSAPDDIAHGEIRLIRGGFK
jgi:hypothetical protein